MPGAQIVDSARAVERHRRRAIVALAGLPALALFLAERWVFGDWRGFPLDDAWIHLEFARNLAHGAGLAFNPGARVAGSTAPLWTALLAILAVLPGSLAAWTKLAGLAAHVATLVATYRLGRALDLTPRRTALAVALVGATDWLVFAAPSGMEVGLFAALSLAAMARQITERREPGRPPVAFLLCALAALARPEGLLLLLLAALDRAVTADGTGWRVDPRGIRSAALGLAVAATMLVPVGLAFTALSGSPWPTTLAAKSPGPAELVPQLRHLAQVFELLFASQALPTLLAAAGAVELLQRPAAGPSGRSWRGLLPALWLIALPLAGSALTAPGRGLAAGNFGRYYFPLLPVVVLLGVLGLAPLSFARLRELRVGARLRLPIGVAAVTLLVGLPLLRTVHGASLYLQARANLAESDLAAAHWLAAHVPPDAVVAAVDIGALRYELPNPILDLAGIAQPGLVRFLERARREQGLDWQRALLVWIERRRPDYVVVYPAWFPLLERDPRRFPALARFRIHGNIAMAGDQLVVYATPWTRKDPAP